MRTDGPDGESAGLPDVVPTLERAPVRLRPWRYDDAGLVLAVADDPLIPLVTTVPRDGRRASAAAYVERQHRRLDEGTGFSFVVADLETDRPMGSIGLWTGDIAWGRASTGYWMAPEFRRRGHLTAALGLLTEWALGLPAVARLDLRVEPWNEGSWRAAEAVGYEREGLLRSWERVGDRRVDVYVYSILARPRERP